MPSPIPSNTIPGLYLRDGRVWYLRVVVPKELREHYGKATRYHKSLNTRCPKEARAKALTLRAEFESEFIRISDQRRPARLVVLDGDLGRYVVAVAEHQLLEADDNNTFWTEDKALRDRVRGLLERGGQEARQALVDGDLTAARSFADRVVSPLQVELDWAAPASKRTAILVARALVTAYDAVVARRNGQVVPTPPKPDPADIEGRPAESGEPQSPETAGQGAALTLTDLIEPWATVTKAKPDRLPRMRKAVQRWADSGQPAIVGQIARKHGAAFRLWLLDDEQGLSDKTASHMLGCVKTLLTTAADNGEILVNPLARLSVKVTDSERRKPFTKDQLTGLFSSELYASGTQPAHRRAAGWAGYWLPLLGLYTGARVGELGQLDVADIDIETQTIAIHGENDGATLKTEASERTLPIHPELVRLGFLGFVKDMQATRQPYLFPAIRGTAKGPRHEFGLYFRTALDAAGITEPLQTFHAFRHTVRSALAAVGVTDTVADWITGHAGAGSTGRKVYTHSNLEAMREALTKLDYGLKLPAVYPPRH